jgi:2-polyprenyl-3-methyl-5-hydroxy-6-metoxy-1,4-benzoquinol methylase
MSEPGRRDQGFDGADLWLRRLGTLRNLVRQEVVARQLAGALPDRPGLSVLDVGAGQGTQALRLARAGHHVTAVEPDARMRAACAALLALEPPEVQARTRVLEGRIGELETVLGGRTFDVVLCHGVLMYLAAAGPAISELAKRVSAGGLLSLVARNADALAWRPALRGDWAGVHVVLDEVAAATREGRDAFYDNEIGVRARADRVTGLIDACRTAGFTDIHWYGLRMASDSFPVEVPLDTPEDSGTLEAVVSAELRLGSTDPYRLMSTLSHILAR